MRDKLKKINDYSFELPKSGKMNVTGKIFSSENLLSHPGMSSAIKQVADVATLPGIVDSSLASNPGIKEATLVNHTRNQ